MDPKIAAGFSILGNALMPDPARLAQAELSRSAREENIANTRKLGLEADALANAAANLARLQDVLSNPATTARDIIVPGIGAGLTNDPTQIPQFALGAESLEGLDFNDSSSFSRALLGTGTVANQAATPSGFAADQARQVQANEADNQTAMRNADIAAQADRYATDVGARTDIQRETMEGGVDLEIAGQRRVLDELLAKREDLTKRHQISIESNDRAQALGVEAQMKALQRDIDMAIARANDLTEKAIAESQIVGAMEQTKVETAGEMDVAELGAKTDIEEANIAAQARRDVAITAAGGGAGGDDKYAGWAGLSFADRDNIASDVVDRIALRYHPDGDWPDKATRNGYLPRLIPQKTLEAAMKTAANILGSKNTIGIAELVADAMIYDEKTGSWRLDTDALTMPDEETGVPAETSAPVPPAELNGRTIIFESGEWIYEDTGESVE